MSVALKQGIWTPEKRLEKSRALRGRQIWLKSTGPRTPEGKLKSSRNACKPGYEERQAEKAEMKRIVSYLRLQKLFVNTLKFQRKGADLLPFCAQIEIENALNFLENELSILEWEIRNGVPYGSNILPFKGEPPT